MINAQKINGNLQQITTTQLQAHNQSDRHIQNVSGLNMCTVSPPAPVSYYTIWNEMKVACLSGCLKVAIT